MTFIQRRILIEVQHQSRHSDAFVLVSLSLGTLSLSLSLEDLWSELRDNGQFASLSPRTERQVF